MNAEEIHGLSGAYVLDALDDAERDAFDAHLATCPTCRQEVDELRAVHDHLAADAAEPPPPSLRASVLAAIDEVRPLPPLDVDHPGAPTVIDAPVAPPTPLRRRPPTFLLPALAAAAALLLVVGLFAWSPWRNDGTGAPGGAQAVAAAPDAQRIERRLDGFSATVVVSRKRNEAAIFSADMPPPPAGHDYQLWYDRPGKGMVSAGLMPDPVGGNESAVLLDHLDDATAVGVTVEPTGGSPKPTTAPVAVFPIA